MLSKAKVLSHSHGIWTHIKFVCEIASVYGCVHSSNLKKNYYYIFVCSQERNFQTESKKKKNLIRERKSNASNDVITTVGNIKIRDEIGLSWNLKVFLLFFSTSPSTHIIESFSWEMMIALQPITPFHTGNKKP